MTKMRLRAAKTYFNVAKPFRPPSRPKGLRDKDAKNAEYAKAENLAPGNIKARLSASLNCLKYFTWIGRMHRMNKYNPI
jgi:hypothetical protein